MKILSPAGNFLSLKAAIFNGADEVYLGVNEFNARNNIDGFTIDSLKEAVDFAHLFNVKVNLAVNILFTDEELIDAVSLVVRAHNEGVDAFIVQDLGLIKILSENYPNVELHASTQMGLHNLEGVKSILKYGIRRVVLARETPLSEIKRIRDNTDVEIEYFIQGALCVSFSGNCYLSAHLFDASGNRGRCKQLCRLPYTLKKDGKSLKSGYLLSAKDFNMINRLDDLESAGVDVLKIEGRARRPYYVGAVTREYRKAIDGKKVDLENVELAFNRTYTEGYFNGNGKIISELQSHIGVYVGKIEKVVIGKKFNELFILSNRKLYPKSTFKIFSSGKEKATLTAFDIKEQSLGVYRITTTHTAKKGDEVRLIADAFLEEKLLSVEKKKDIKITVRLEGNKPIKAKVYLENQTVEVVGGVCQKALNRPLTIAEIKENFLKSQVFNAVVDVLTLDSVFMPKKELNEFRRKVFETAYEVLTKKYKREEKLIDYGKANAIKTFSEFEVINNLDVKVNSKNVIYSPEEYLLSNVIRFKEKCVSEGRTPYLDTPNFALKADVELLKDIVDKTGVGVVANNYYALSLAKDMVIGAGLNVYNSYAAGEFSLPILSMESDMFSKVKFPYMTLRHCPMKAHLSADCKNCPYSDGYILQSESGEFRLKRKKLSTCTFYLTD